MPYRYLITGATGLIGSSVTKYILNNSTDVSITLPVRNYEKACKIFGDYISRLNIVECDLYEYCANLNDSFDYIIHCASPTSGKYMNEHPVETFELTTKTTRCLLEYACRKKIKSMVYLSSLEYYGQNLNDSPITEDFQGYIDTRSCRSSYPLGKRASEFLCVAYAKEYNIPVKIARLTQTFGPGVSVEDKRVFAQFAKSVINNQNIILHTKGESAKPYCHTNDCVVAILLILQKGENGEAYNVANQDTYISIYEMARFLQDNFNPNIKVQIEEKSGEGYAPITKLRLSSEKLLKLGWTPQYGLKEMFTDLIHSLTKC